MHSLPERSSVSAVWFGGRTTAENPKKTVPLKSTALLLELEQLATKFAELSARLAEDSAQRKPPGALPSGALMASLAEAYKSFSALREKALELAGSLAVPYGGDPEGLSAPEDLKRLLEQAASAEARIMQIAEGTREAEQDAEPADGGHEEPGARAGGHTGGGETMGEPTAAGPSFASGLPSELEEFLEKIIEDASKAKGTQQRVPSEASAIPPPAVSQKEEPPAAKDTRA
ncbi:MAG: hypothetical protein HY648_05280, partial [Acidobacteria bacterium]|nr:hypothetical protein [Acidobacteriota bacterium]